MRGFIMNIKKMLEVLTKEKGMKQVDISKKTGVSISTISRSLKGKFIPNYRNGKAIEILYNEVVAGEQKAG